MSTPARVRLADKKWTAAQPQIAAVPAVFRYNAARSAGDARVYGQPIELAFVLEPPGSG
jgi:hypothetical protein